MPVKYGMNLLLWTDDPTGEAWLPLCEHLAAMGFDGVELPVMGEVDPEAFRVLGRRLEDMGLARTAVSVRGEAEDPISSDPAVRWAALLATQRAIDCCDAAGAALLGGPLYAAIGRFSGAGPSAEEWAHSVECLRAASDYAANAGVTLALEFLNRFEIYLLNCAADTARFVGEIDHASCTVHYDTFHAHIEEKDPAAAIAACGESLGTQTPQNNRLQSSGNCRPGFLASLLTAD